MGIGMSSMVAILSLAFTLAMRRRRLVVYDWGLVHVALRKTTMRFDEITTIGSSASSAAPDDPTSRLVLHDALGQRVALTVLDIAGVQKAAEAILDRVMPLLLADQGRRIRSGDAVEYGPVRATRSGVTVRGQHHDWAHLRHVDLVDAGWGIFVADREAPISKLPLETGNVLVLAQLIGQMQAASSSTPA